MYYTTKIFTLPQNKSQDQKKLINEQTHLIMTTLNKLLKKYLIIKQYTV